LPSAVPGALGKVFFQKKDIFKTSLPSVVPGALGKVFFKKKIYRVPDLRHSTKNFF